MKYELLYENFISLYPNDRDKIGKIAEASDVDPSDGMHIVFGMVVIPFIVELLENKEEEKLKKAFSFFEEMAKDKNSLISEVLEFTILEDFISRGENFLNRCKKYMGSETKKSCIYLEQYM